MPESRVLPCDKTTWNGREAKKLSLAGSSCVHWLTTRCHPFYTLLQTPVCFVCNVCFCLILHSRLRVGFEVAFSCAVIFCTSKPTLVMNVVHAVWAGFQKKWRQPTVFLRLSIGLGLVRRTFHWILFLCLDTVLLVGLDHMFLLFFTCQSLKNQGPSQTFFCSEPCGSSEWSNKGAFVCLSLLFQSRTFETVTRRNRALKTVTSGPRVSKNCSLAIGACLPRVNFSRVYVCV